MSNDSPSADELRQGLTVRIVQEDADAHSVDEDPITGEIATVYEDDPEEPHVELKNRRRRVRSVGRRRRVEWWCHGCDRPFLGDRGRSPIESRRRHE